MPIYEFYCKKCHTVYSFFSKSVNTEKIPKCPTCKRISLTRQMSVFAAVTGGPRDDGAADDPFAGMDESRMEKAMMQLASEAEGMPDDDPRAAASLMRKLSDATGMKLGSGFEEALSRLAAGEDPDQIDQDLGDLLSEEELFTPGRKGKSSSRKPRVDETLYDL